jgi:hypothetical protein
MKTVLTIALLASVTSFAQSRNNQPCKQVKAACEAAGFKTGDAKKNLWKSCIDPIVNGKSIPGVSVDTLTIAACRKQHQL